MAAPSPERQNGLRRRGFLAASVLFIVAMLASTAHDLWASHGNAERRASEEIAVLARVLAEQTRRSVQTVDVMLLAIANDDRRGELAHVDAARLRDYLRRGQGEVTDVPVVFITDATGAVVASSDEVPAAVAMARSTAFERLRAGSDAAVDGIVRLPGERRWLLPILHRIQTPEGRFAGSVVALLDVGYFERFYANARLGDDGDVVALHGADGALLVRHPAHDDLVGRTRPSWGGSLSRTGGEAQPRRFMSAVDGVERIGLAQPVPGYALYVVVTRDTRKIFGPWRDAAVGSMARTLLLCALAAALVAIVLRQLQRLERARELEVRLRTAQKLEAMGTLAGGIAHDFNNILGAILGYAELALAQAAPRSTLAEQLQGVMAAGLRAKSLVQRILAFSRSGLGEKVPVHAQSVVAEALDLVEASLPADLRLQRDLRAGDAALVGDPAQIHQVVMNLAMNAVQACPSPGGVWVALAPRTLAAAHEFTSGELPAGHYLELVVRDEGPGIAPGELERIFDPFFTTKSVGVGTGLGLSLVHGIVTELQGAIDVASSAGHGATFTVLLPWAGAAVPDPRRAQPPGELPQGNGERVLVIDDEAALVALAEETLASLGYEPVGHTSAADALRAFESEPHAWDAVLTDEMMPQLAGSEIAAAVHRRRPELPVLLMTGYVTSALVERAQRAGVAEVLGKPLVARDLARALAKVVRRHATSP